MIIEKDELLEKYDWKILRIKTELLQNKEKVADLVNNFIMKNPILPEFEQWKTKEEIRLVNYEKALQEGRITNNKILSNKLTIAEIEKRKLMIEGLNIDFSKKGWLHEVAKTVGYSEQYIRRFMKKHMMVFLNSCRKY